MNWDAVGGSMLLAGIVSLLFGWSAYAWYWVFLGVFVCR